MFSIAGIDLLEQELLDHERTLLEILLQDKTTKKNIIWATDDYAVTGETIPISQRIGLLDRKLRVVSENTDTEEQIDLCLGCKKMAA